jgi:hypothetical protein
VDTACDDLLAASALTDETDGDVLPSDLLQQSIEPFHRARDHHWLEKDVDLTLSVHGGRRYYADLA